MGKVNVQMQPGATNQLGGAHSDHANTQPQNQQPGRQNPQPADQPAPSQPPAMPDVQQALQNNARVVKFTPRANKDLLASLKELEQLTDEVKNTCAQHRGVKWYIIVSASYSKVTPDGEVRTATPTFRTRVAITLQGTDIDEQIADAYQQLYERADEFQREGSGWSFDQVDHIDLHTVAYQPLSGSKYFDLPKAIKSTRSVLNIQNTDQKCILWCILAHLHPLDRMQHPERASKYKQYETEINMHGVPFPTPLSSIERIENNNPNLSIAVFGYDKDDGVYPLRRAKEIRESHIQLLLIRDGDESHYCLIRNFNRLLASRTKHHGGSHHCENCLHGFSSRALLEKHETLCHDQKAQRTEFPKEGSILKFKNFSRQLRVPCVIYADFESFTTTIDTCEQNPQTSNTTAYQKHEASGFGYQVVFANNEHASKPTIYQGPNAVDAFFDHLLHENERIQDILSKPKPMVISAEQEQAFKHASNCFICGTALGADRVRDHDHLTGDYRGAAHNECNINFRYPFVGGKHNRQFVVPVVFHNLRGYDSHLLMGSLGKFKQKRISCIPNNTERYMSFSLDGLRFIDSLQFMPASLDQLVTNLASEGKDKFRQLAANIKDHKQRDVLLRKGVYPYDYINSQKRLEETKLPAPEAFYSQLNEEPISSADYAHAQEVWKLFSCGTMRDYHNVYLKSDVLLLADVFESFRDMTMETYKLDPAQYFTTPGLSWDSMLKHTKVELELLHDPDMFLMIDSAIRGGVSVITHKHAKANNPLISGYDIAKPRNWLIYLDANNLYGWAMSRRLPEREFAWMSEDEISNFDVASVLTDSNTGYILDVDLEYPPDLHDLHNDLPLAPENRAVSNDELSRYSLGLQQSIGVKRGAKPENKLIPNLHDKSRYIVHYENLKQYLALGMRLRHIHRGISFHQSCWLEPYITLNTERRKAAKNAFEQDFYKYLNNSIFGKTMENVRGRVNLELVHTSKRLRKLTAKPNFNRVCIFNENLLAAQCLKTQIMLDKPIYVGFSILDLSKSLMYEFHYGTIKAKYGNSATLCFTDTDSLLYSIRTHDLYADMKADSQLYDTSGYPTWHPLHNLDNKKVLGKMKDETAGVPISEFVGLRSKMYSLMCGGVEKKTAKGVKKAAIKRRLRHHMYRDVLYKEIVTFATMRAIRSFSHTLYSVMQNKRALSAFDDKRFVLADKVTTRAHGHYLNALE